MDDSNSDTKSFMLTTVDNPFNPFTQFDEWDAFDRGQGYFTCAYLARIAQTSEDLSEADELFEINRAMDEIISINIYGRYIKVDLETATKRSKQMLGG